MTRELEDGTYEGRPRLVKLVRDRIDLFLAGRNSHVSYIRFADDATHIMELRKKLIEECAEYVIEPSKGELADILQVIIDLSVLDMKCGWIAVEDEMGHKHNERGGFRVGLGMYVTSESDESARFFGNDERRFP